MLTKDDVERITENVLRGLSLETSEYIYDNMVRIKLCYRDQELSHVDIMFPDIPE